MKSKTQSAQKSARCRVQRIVRLARVAQTIRECHHCKLKHAVIEDGYCVHCRKSAPLRNMMRPPKWYDQLDKGIRFAVRILHAYGFETCQSCQGGADPARPQRGHAYDRPTVDLVATGDDALGFAALATLQDFGLKVRDLSILWPIKNGLPYEKLWRITFWETMEALADEVPMFVWGYQAQPND